MFGIDFRNLGMRLPVLEVHGMYISYARLLAFGTALAGMVVVYLFLPAPIPAPRSARSRRTGRSCR